MQFVARALSAMRPPVLLIVVFLLSARCTANARAPASRRNENNGSDCGVFVLEYVERFILDLQRRTHEHEQIQSYINKKVRLQQYHTRFSLSCEL